MSGCMVGGNKIHSHTTLPVNASIKFKLLSISRLDGIFVRCAILSKGVALQHVLYSELRPWSKYKSTVDLKYSHHVL